MAIDLVTLGIEKYLGRDRLNALSSANGIVLPDINKNFPVSSRFSSSRIGAIFLQGIQVRAPKSTTEGLPEARAARMVASLAGWSSTAKARAGNNSAKRAITNRVTGIEHSLG